MALNSSLLAEEVRTALTFPTPTSQQILGWAQGIVEEITTNGIATFGNISSPHPISGLDGTSMANRIVTYAGYPFASTQLINYCTAIATHIMTSGIVTYTSPVPAPPAIPPSAAWFLDGTISGLSGSVMASLVQAAVGYPNISPKLLAKCTAIADHITANAEVVSGVIS